MAEYFVNRNEQANGDHEVHHIGCLYMPEPRNRIYLGNFPSCEEAVHAAKRYYAQSNGCFTCSRDCNRS